MLPGIWLILAIPVTVLILLPLGKLLNMSSEIDDPLLAAGFVSSHVLTGYLWARGLTRRAGMPASRLSNLAAGIGFAVSIIAVELNPTLLDSMVALPAVQGTTHLEFKVVFVTWTGFATGLTGFALGLGLKRWQLALKLLVTGFLTGAGIFLTVAVLMDGLGFRVGVARADGIPSMPIVTALGVWLAALVGTGVFWLVLSRSEVAEISAGSPPLEQHRPALQE